MTWEGKVFDGSSIGCLGVFHGFFMSFLGFFLLFSMFFFSKSLDFPCFFLFFFGLSLYFFKVVGLRFLLGNS